MIPCLVICVEDTAILVVLSVDRKQCTILWHENDLKVSHVNPDVVVPVIGWKNLLARKPHS